MSRASSINSSMAEKSRAVRMTNSCYHPPLAKARADNGPTSSDQLFQPAKDSNKVWAVRHLMPMRSPYWQNPLVFMVKAAGWVQFIQRSRCTSGASMN